jgi:hypothetical protein
MKNNIKYGLLNMIYYRKYRKKSQFRRFIVPHRQDGGNFAIYLNSIMDNNNYIATEMIQFVKTTLN